MPNVGRKAKNEEHVQSVLFDKDKWTKDGARDWLKEHKYYSDGLDETESLYRFRQYDPDADKFRYRNKAVGKGITFVMGYPKSKNASADPQLFVLTGACQSHTQEHPVIVGFKAFLDDGQGGQVEVSDRAKLYEAFKTAQAAGKLFKLGLTIKPHINDGDNSNAWDFADEVYARIATTFAGRPFLRDHFSYEMKAKGGNILSSSAVGYGKAAHMIQEVELTEDWAIDLVLRGTMTEFSIGMNMHDISCYCSVCGGAIWDKGSLSWECNHYPGKLYTIEGKGEVQCRWIITDGTGKETSGVVDPAVSGTGIENIQQLAASCGKPSKEVKLMDPEQLQAQVASLETDLAAAKRVAEEAQSDLATEKEAHAKVKADLDLAQKEIGAVRASVCADLVGRIKEIRASSDLFTGMEPPTAPAEDADLIAGSAHLRASLLADQILVERDKRDMIPPGDVAQEAATIKAQRDELLHKSPEVLAEVLAEVRRVPLPKLQPPMGRGSVTQPTQEERDAVLSAMQQRSNPSPQPPATTQGIDTYDPEKMAAVALGGR